MRTQRANMGSLIGLIAIALCFSTACSPETVSPETLNEENVAVKSVTGAQPLTPLEHIGVGLAAVLREPSSRAWLLSSISLSPYVERRLPLRRMIAADTSARLRDVLQKSGRAFSREQLAALPDLELYLPVRQQREQLASATRIQVAVRTTADSFFIIRSDGSAFRVDEWYNPGAVTTVALGPSEVDYDDVESAVIGGARTGTAMLAAAKAASEPASAADGSIFVAGSLPHAECDPEIQNCGGGGGGTPPPPPVGGNTASKTYVTLFTLIANMEGMLMGANEIEIFGQVNNAYASCASATELTYGITYWWATTPGHVAATAIPINAYKFKLQAYEDDDDRCLVQPTDDHLGNWDTGITISQYGTEYRTDAPYWAYIKVSAAP